MYNMVNGVTRSGHAMHELKKQGTGMKRCGNWQGRTVHINTHQAAIGCATQDGGYKEASWA